MINWTEEDVSFITENILLPVFKVHIEKTAKEIDKLFEVNDKVDAQLRDSILMLHDELEYRRRRDVTFFLEMLCQANHLDKPATYELYNKFCEDYDETNKEKE